MQRSALAYPLRHPRRLMFGILAGLGVCSFAMAAAVPATHRAKVTARHPVAATRPVAARHSTGAAHRNGTVGQAGLRIFRDSETGLIGPPTPQQAAALAASDGSDLEFSSEGLHEEQLPGGGVRVNLQGRFQESAVARKNAAGKVEWDCVSGTKAAKRFKDGAGAPPATKWEVQ